MWKPEHRLIRWSHITLLAAAVIAPREILATVAAAQSRIMTVYLRSSADTVLEALRSAGSAAGLSCQSLHVGDDRAFQCTPSGSDEGFQGFLEAVEVRKYHAVVVSAYSSNVTTPHGELHPLVDLAMSNFRQAIIQDPNVSRLVECVAPDYNACVLPP